MAITFSYKADCNGGARQIIGNAIACTLYLPCFLANCINQKIGEKYNVDPNAIRKQAFVLVALYTVAGIIGAIHGYLNKTAGYDVTHHVKENHHLDDNNDDWRIDDDATDPATGQTFHNLGHNAAAWNAFIWATYSQFTILYYAFRACLNQNITADGLNAKVANYDDEATDALQEGLLTSPPPLTRIV